jgi:hypothetical protein
MTFFDTGHTNAELRNDDVAGSSSDVVWGIPDITPGTTVGSDLMEDHPVLDGDERLGSPVVDGMTTFQAVWSFPQEEPTTFRSDVELGGSTTFSR